MVSDQLASTAYPVVPISLYRPGSAWAAVLSGYKSSRSAAERRSLSDAMAAIVGGFLADCRRLLGSTAGGGWDSICVVPSTRADRPRHPLASVVDESFAGLRCEDLLRRGAEPVGRRRPRAGAFTAEARADGRRVLLLDDTFTTGATSRSAAHALDRAGATVVALVVLGRLVRPSERGVDPRWWEHHTYPVTASFSRKNPITWSSAPLLALPSSSFRSSVSTEWAAVR